MIRLRDAVNETIHLSVPDALQCMVVVDRVDCDHAVRTFHTIGDTSPLHATATGRAILAHLPRADVDELIDRGLESYSESTPAEPDLLRAELERVRADGYAVNRNQYRPDVCAVAAAILDENGTPSPPWPCPCRTRATTPNGFPSWGSWWRTRPRRSPGGAWGREPPR